MDSFIEACSGLKGSKVLSSEVKFSFEGFAFLLVASLGSDALSSVMGLGLELWKEGFVEHLWALLILRDLRIPRCLSPVHSTPPSASLSTTTSVGK